MTTIEFAQKVKAKYPEYQNINDEELAQKVLEKYPEYRDRVEIGVKTTPATQPAPTQPTTMPATPQKGILRQMGEAIVKPFAELGVSAVNLAKNVKSVATGENKDYSKQSYNLPYVGETKPAFTGDENFGDFTKKTVGYGAEVGSMFIGGGTSKKAVTTGIKGLTKQAAITGLKEGAAIGGASSAGTSLREGNSLPQILKDTAVGVVGGGVLGGGLGGASGAVTNKVKLLKNVRAQKAAEGVDNFLNQVFQGKDEDIAIARKALTNLDLTGVKNYKDLTRLLNDNIKGISTRLDDVLDKDKSVKLLDNLNTLFDVDGQKIAKNFAQDAIEQLDELYTKTNDPVSLAKIRNLATKANTQGLTTKEINDLAKTYGREFGKKAFSKMGDPLTSVNAQNYENTRKGVKELARRLYGNDAPRMADEELTNLIRVRDLSGKMINKVNDLKKKVLKDRMGTRVVNAVLKVSDFMSFGSLSGIKKFFIPRGEGFKIANALDLEKNLTKSLKQIQKALKSQDEKEIYKILNSLLKLEKPAPLMLPAPGKTLRTANTINLPAKTLSTKEAEEITRIQAQISKNKKLPSKPAVLSKKKEVNKVVSLKEVSSFLTKAYKDAPLAKKEIDEYAQSIASKYKGTVAVAPLKAKEKVIFNINNKYKGDVSRVSDIARNTIIVDKPSIAKVFRELESGKNYFGGKYVDPTKDPLGYSGYNTKFVASNGHISEIQINTPEMIYAKEPAKSAISQLGLDVYSKLNKLYNGSGGKGHLYYDDWALAYEKGDVELYKKIENESKKYYSQFIK